MRAPDRPSIIHQDHLRSPGSEKTRALRKEVYIQNRIAGNSQVGIRVIALSRFITLCARAGLAQRTAVTGATWRNYTHIGTDGLRFALFPKVFEEEAYGARCQSDLMHTASNASFEIELHSEKT